MPTRSNDFPSLFANTMPLVKSMFSATMSCVGMLIVMLKPLLATWLKEMPIVIPNQFVYGTSSIVKLSVSSTSS